jgi:hypothetical protein
MPRSARCDQQLGLGTGIFPDTGKIRLLPGVIVKEIGEVVGTANGRFGQRQHRDQLAQDHPVTFDDDSTKGVTDL